MEIENSTFWIGFIAWKDFEPHGYQLTALEKILNQRLKIADYGERILSFNFIPMALRPTNKIHEEEISYSPRKKELNIHLKLDYQQLINAGLNGFLPLVGQLLLEGIDRATQQKIKDFDWISFRKDVSDLLTENGWLLPAEQV